MTRSPYPLKSGLVHPLPERLDPNLERVLSASTSVLSAVTDAHVVLQTEEEPPSLLWEKHECRLPVASSQEKMSLPVLRGMADILALKLRFHDPLIYHHLAKEMEDPTLLPAIERAEEVRLELVGAKDYPGLSANIHAAWEKTLQNHVTPLPTFSLFDPTLEPLMLLLREALLERPLTPLLEAYVSSYRKLLVPIITSFKDELKTTAENQTLFAKTIFKLLKALAIASASEGAATATETTFMAEETEASSEEASQEIPAILDSVSSLIPSLEETKTESEVIPAPKGVVMVPESVMIPNTPPREGGILVSTHYHAYTYQFDQIVHAEMLAKEAELTLLRRQLDQRLANLDPVTLQAAHRLQRKLMAKHEYWWELHQEEGVLDTAKLTQIIANPLYAHYYKQEKTNESYHTVVTLLLDNSGSMRGRPILVAAMSSDILARTLERCGVKVEILGFTSCDWKGGQTKQLWMSQGQPPHPGRLNDLRHIIYKAADVPWRRAKKNLGLMLKEGILKENIDGEAILWAYERLLKRPEQRKILMVISDGAPVDDSTQTFNPGTYLENHLREVIHYIEHRQCVQLAAIGIGHDVTRFYQHAVTIREVEQLSDTMFNELAALF